MENPTYNTGVDRTTEKIRWKKILRENHNPSNSRALSPSMASLSAAAISSAKYAKQDF